MATLELSLNSLDGYSSSIDKIIRKTYQVVDKVFEANVQIDKINNKFEASGTSAGKASIGFSKLFKSLASIENIKKGMGIIDEFTNTSTRLALINDGLQTQTELQNKVFAAADRSRGSYTEMASAIYSMGTMAKDSFKSNDELVAFAELSQKSFKAGGASAADQSSAWQKLTQAMSDGNMKAEDFLYLMEKAPIMTDAIAKFTGKSNEELEKMAAEGVITSDIIKNAMFMAANGINTEFGKTDMTFADLWNKIKNGGLRVFEPLMDSINKIINTDGFQAFINNIIYGVSLLAGMINWLLNIVIKNWNIIGPVLAAIGGYLLAGIITKLWSTAVPLLENFKLLSMIKSPIFLVILAIGIAVAALNAFGISTETILGSVFSAFWGLFSFIYNMIAGAVNLFFTFSDFLRNFLIDPIAAIKVLFIDLVLSIVGWISNLATSLVEVVNMIPGIKLNTASGLEGILSNLQKARDDISNENDLVKTVRWDYKSLDEMMDEGYNFGSNLAAGSWFDDIDNPFDFNKYANPDTPVIVEGMGNNGAVEVNMADEDLQYMRDIAERDYINQFNTATLAPSIQMTFGDIHEEADANKVAGSIKRILQEEIAMAAEGAYS